MKNPEHTVAKECRLLSLKEGFHFSRVALLLTRREPRLPQSHTLPIPRVCLSLGSCSVDRNLVPCHMELQTVLPVESGWTVISLDTIVISPATILLQCSLPYPWFCFPWFQLPTINYGPKILNGKF